MDAALQAIRTADVGKQQLEGGDIHDCRMPEEILLCVVLERSFKAGLKSRVLCIFFIPPSLVKAAIACEGSGVNGSR